MRFIARVVIAVLGLAGVAVIAGGCYLRARLQASLPQLDGTVALAGLDAPVRVTRDAYGVPTVTSASRRDAARALGFLHAQDRFFQMDLQRRQPAGELSALVGARALDADAQARVHRFRRISTEALARATPEWRDLLEAYAAGVNAGLAALGAPPFEYLLLRASPEPWRAEDSILTVFAMFGSLQGRQAIFEQTNQQLRAALPEPFFRFLTAAGSDWDTPVAGVGGARPGVPGPDVIDLRTDGARRRPAARGAPAAGRPLPARDPIRDSPLARAASPRAVCWPLCADGNADEAAIIGSNNWAVDGAHSASGRALVANDMHLNIGVPNIWYRASIVVPDPSDPPATLRLDGVTLPGLPVLVVGSNGHVAWGFTNTGGDWSDLVRIEPDPTDANRYRTPEGWRALEVVRETIAVKGEPPRTIDLRQTIWGPIVWTDADGREYAQRWVAHDVSVMSSDLSRPERTRTVDELLVAVSGLGLPHQNVIMGDAEGRIAWTVGGAVPRRRGLDGFVPESWADGTRGWDGYLDVNSTPRIVDPPGGRLWTANAPVVDGAQLAVLGDGGYADGIRARIIRDRLLSLERATPVQMLHIQLDDTALFLDRWRAVALGALGRPEAASPVDRRAARAEFRRVLDTTWTGRASPDSAGYRLARTFRSHVVRLVMRFVTAPAHARDASFDYTRTLRTEGPVWALVSARPMHLLDPRFGSWDDLLLAAVDEAIAELTEGGRTLADRTWGEFNRAQIAHPLASAVPRLGRWLTMPEAPLPGDVYTPRAHSPRAGPSERLVVSPGDEANGILHMPTGQSAHPWSPHFRDMHDAWVSGTPVPLRPGPAVHMLTLTPR